MPIGTTAGAVGTGCSLDSWVSDVVFHLAYGLSTAIAYDFLADV